MRNKFLLLSLLLLFIYANAFYSQNKAFIQESEYSLQDTVLAVRFIAKGDSLFQISKYDSSNTYFEKGKEIYDVLYQKYNEVDFLRKSLHCENKIGWNFIILGEYKIVLLRLQQALDYAGKHIDESFIEAAHSYQIIGETYLKQSDYFNAIENHQKSIALKLKLLGEGTRQLVSNYTSLGIIYFELGDYDTALDYYLKALELTPLQENRNKLLIAKFYNNIGNVYDKKGDLEKALEFHKNSLSIRIGQLGEDHIEVSSSYTNIGIICSRKGNYVDALDYFNKSLAIKQQVLGELHPDVARNYGNIGDNYYNLRDYENAIKYSLKSLEIITSILGEENPAAINRYITLGNIYKDKSDFELSIEYLEKAITSAIKIFGSKHPDIGKSYTHLAEVYNLKNDFKTALKFCQKSIVSLVEAYENESIYDNPELEGILSETELLNTLSLKARIFNELSELTDLKMSLSTFQLAVNLLDKMRTGYKSEGSKLFLREQASEIYAQAINTSLKLFDLTNESEYKQRAFLFAEKSKAAVLQDGIAEVQARQFAGVSSDLLNEEKQLRINLVFYETELQKELQKKDSLDKNKITELENQLFALKSRYEELISHLEKKYPDYFNLKYQTKTITVRDVQEHLPDNTALIEYFIGSDIIYIFTFSRDEIDIISIKKPNNFEEIIKVFYSSILKTDRENYIKLGNELSKCLIMPVISNPVLQSKEKLVIIPHELLHIIPFEALFTSTQSYDQSDYTEYNYLIKKFDISYHYSASLYNNTPGPDTDKDDNFIGLQVGFVGVGYAGATARGRGPGWRSG
ncbi:MAG: tetratricopeptide repeat protein [Ignavibacteriaceae bacterium]